MGEFWIGCTTCHARLKVRDASVIGQIVACPKCGSMVLIGAPASAVHDAAAAGSENPDVAAASAAAPTPTPTAIAGLALDDINDLVAGRMPAPPATAPAQNTTGAATATAESAAANEITAPTSTSSGDVESLQTRAALWRWPKPLLLAGAGLVGLALATVVFIVVPGLLGRRGGTQVPSGTPIRGGTPVAQLDSDPEPKPEAPDQTAKVSLTAPTQRPADDKRPVDPPPVDSSKPPPGDANPSKPGNEVLPVEPAPAKPAERSSESPAESGDELPGPPDLKPGTKIDAARSGPQPVAGRFAQLLSGIPPESVDARSTKPGVETPSETTTAKEEAEGPEILRPRMREVDVPARLADPLAAIEFSNVALADYAQVLSDLSTLPITLDVDALLLRRLSPNTPVQIKLAGTTVRDALNGALEPLKLGFVATNGQVVISHPAPVEGMQRKRSHDVTDLVGNDPQQLATLSSWVLELVDPDSWSEAGGTGILRAEGGALTIEQSDSAHLQVMLLCDKLRAARGLPPRGKFPASVINPDSLATRAQTALATPLKLNFARPTRLSQILDRFGKIASVRIVVDWRALAEAGWPPETSATLTVDDRPLTDALNQLLAPRDLAFRIVDDGTLQVTTPAAVERRIEWEFYSLAEQPAERFDAEAFLQRLVDAVGSNYFRGNGGMGAVYYDAASRCVLVALPQPQQRMVMAFLRSANGKGD